jgi:hypothetical protein
VPVASLAKIMTAYVMLRNHPLTDRILDGTVLGIPAARQGLVEPALAAGEALASTVPGAAQLVTVLLAGSVVGELAAPWRKDPVPVVTSRALTGLVISGTSIAFRADLSWPPPATARREAGPAQHGPLRVEGGTPAAGDEQVLQTAGAAQPWRDVMVIVTTG